MISERFSASAVSLPCRQLFRPKGELLFIAIKSNQKALARFHSKARLKIVVQGENATRDLLASNRSNTRFLKTLANNFQPARSNGPAPAVFFGF
jgi:hypothetical protein